MSKPLKLRIINTVFRVISSILPTKKRVLFLGTPRSEKLLANTQLVYDNITNCEKKEINKLIPHSITDIIYISFFIMTSNVIVIDDSYRYFEYIPLKKNQKLVQLWHGPGAFKKLGLDVPTNPPEINYPHEQYDALIVSSKEISWTWESAFNLSKENIKTLGYPITDLLLNHLEELENNFYNKYPQLKDKHIIFYAPTYRRYDGEMNILDFDYNLDWNKLNEFLEEYDAILIVKKHPLAIQQNIDFVPKDLDRIIEINDVESYELNAVSDLLITDFSGVYFEFLMLDRPIIFYCPDTEEYLSKHGVYINFPEEVPGEYCETCDELIETIKTIDYNVDYSEYKEFYMGACDGHSTEKVVKLIESYYNE